MSAELVSSGSTGWSGVNRYTGQSLARPVARATCRELDRVSARSDVELATDAVRAGLTDAALHNVGTLIMTGQALMQVAPEGGCYYEALISAYATGAARTVARFQ